MPKIDYSIRPAKSIERKMLVEALSRLSKLQRPDQYRYVGFGAIYFRDFSLFHRVLGISDMKSIEHNRAEQVRYWFNRPYKCIDMLFGPSRSELPSAGLDEKQSIVWLDYEKPLSTDVLKDVEYFCTEALAGSVLIVSVNARPEELEEDMDEYVDDELNNEGEAEGNETTLSPLERLKKRLPGKIPITTKSAELVGWGTANLFRTIIENQIQETISARNGGLARPEHFVYKRLFDFHYADAAKMLTVGGIVYNSQQGEAVDACNFEELPYCNPDNHPFYIPTPRLTYKERRHLDTRLPRGEFTDVNTKGIPAKDIDDYTRIYRHFPNFGETDL